MPRPPRIHTLAEAVAAVDTDPVQRAAWMKEGDADAVALEGDARGYMFALAGWKEIDRIKKPFRTEQAVYGAELKAVEREAGRIADGVIREQCRIAARARAIAAVYADPERRSQETVTGGYERGVAVWAWSQGNKEAAALTQWRRLIAARLEAEEDDDDREIARCDARLLALVGIPYPQYPEAAWLAADTYSQGERQAEYDRLTEIWGPRNAARNGNGKVRSTRRLQRPLSSIVN